ELILFHLPGYFRRLGNYHARRATISAESKIEIGKDVLKVKAISHFESALEDRLGNLEPDEVVIVFRAIAASRHLNYIEPELSLEVRLRVFNVRHPLPIFGAQLWIKHGDRAVHRHCVPVVIGNVVRERTQSERVFIEILRFSEQRFDEVAASYVVHEVGEELASERVITHVLNNRAAIGVSVRLSQLLGGRMRKPFQQHWFD